jgi:hypothetical protein
MGEIRLLLKVPLAELADRRKDIGGLVPKESKQFVLENAVTKRLSG